MTAHPPVSGADIGLPTLGTLLDSALIIRGLLDAMDRYADAAPEGLFAVITVARPLMKRLTDDIEQMDAAL